MKITAIILMVILFTACLCTCALATSLTVPADSATAPVDSTTAPTDNATLQTGQGEQSTQPPQEGGFKLEWYHYVITAAIIFGMTLFTSGTIKPAKK
ncbi:MAG: hypothetical protein IKK58_04605 [Clostridia bacterium]|nr:hypothetical protein [Clostridia bacterium]